MTSLDDLKRTIRRNKLLGMWAAEKLGITGRDADAYSDALAVGTLDPESSDVLSKIRRTSTPRAWSNLTSRFYTS
jgi:hypothetical protein